MSARLYAPWLRLVEMGLLTQAEAALPTLRLDRYLLCTSQVLEASKRYADFHSRSPDLVPLEQPSQVVG